MALASSSWVQTCFRKPRWRQEFRCHSVPTQCTSFNQMGPVPSPNQAPGGAERASPQSSSRHTTATSRISQSSSHTVPHSPWWKTSTRPMQRFGPPVRRTVKGPARRKRSQMETFMLSPILIFDTLLPTLKSVLLIQLLHWSAVTFIPNS